MNKETLVNNVVLETPAQYTERLEKENNQRLKISSVDLALKLNAGTQSDANKLVKSAEVIYKFIIK